MFFLLEREGFCVCIQLVLKDGASETNFPNSDIASEPG